MDKAKLKLTGLITLAIIIVWALVWWIQPYFEGLRAINPIIFSLGGFGVHWYGLLMASAILVAVVWLDRATKNTIWAPHVLGLVTSAAFAGIVGARLLFVVLKWLYLAGTPWEILNLPGGGLSIHGALLGGLIAIYAYCLTHRLPLLVTLDMFAPVAAFGQALGRWGNFFNQEAFGPPTQLPWKMYVAPEFRPVIYQNENWFHPTFLYESLGLLIIVALLSAIARRKPVAGSVALIYLIAYSVLRFGIEFFRADSDKWGVLSVAQWGSLAIILLGCIGGLILRYSKYPK